MQQNAEKIVCTKPKKNYHSKHLKDDREQRRARREVKRGGGL